MKKFLALMLAVVMVFAFAACGEKATKTETNEPAGDVTLDIAMELTSEEYGIGFRKGSDLTAEVNKLMAELTEDGTLPALAEKYSLTLAE